MNDDFYIGYLDESPSRLARHTRRLVLALAVLVVGLTAVFAARQTPAEPGVFEFGVRRTFEGVLHESPLPMLRSVAANGAVTNYLLVGEGKHGLPPFARGHDGQRVRFAGSLIQKDKDVMVEMNDAGSFTVLGPAAAEIPPVLKTVGDVSLTGELVDTKCYFGVMRPATGKVHRACAVRCLSGGVPPGLLVREVEGSAEVVLLSGPNDQPLKFDVEWAGRLVQAEGRLTRRDGVPCLEVIRFSLADTGLPNGPK
jgi:hypothetical protein